MYLTLLATKAEGAENGSFQLQLKCHFWFFEAEFSQIFTLNCAGPGHGMVPNPYPVQFWTGPVTGSGPGPRYGTGTTDQPESKFTGTGTRTKFQKPEPKLELDLPEPEPESKISTEPVRNKFDTSINNT